MASQLPANYIPRMWRSSAIADDDANSFQRVGEAGSGPQRWRGLRSLNSTPRANIEVSNSLISRRSLVRPLGPSLVLLCYLCSTRPRTTEH